jgi:LysM repeat protein
MKKHGPKIEERNLKYTNVKIGFLLMLNTGIFLRSLLFCVILIFCDLGAARNRPSYEEDRGILIREILDSLDSLRSEVTNHETEIRIFEERFKNQEEILDSIRNQTNVAVQGVKESLKGHSGTLESRLARHDDNTKGLSEDFKLFSKEYGQVLAEYKSRLFELEKVFEAQNRNIESLQVAMNALIEAIQPKEMPKTNPSAQSQNASTIYRVKAGDSLEKIAKQNQTTIKKIKELNNLTSDQIIIGQKLIISE